jgi:hypothetical protein
VTRDFGSAVVAAPEPVAITAGLTAMRQLQRTQRTTTSYGGRYVTSIGELREDADSSWLYYVDGVEAPRGASSVRLRTGQQVQWDFHAWQTIRTGGAIVGAFPRPLSSHGVRVICQPRRSVACANVRSALRAAGIPSVRSAQARIVVGRWRDIEGLDGVPDLTTDGDANGAYAEFSSDGRRLTPFSADGSSGRVIDRAAGLLVAFAADSAVTWLVTGNDRRGVVDAAALLRRPELLRHRFGMLTADGVGRPLPEGIGR